MNKFKKLGIFFIIFFFLPINIFALNKSIFNMDVSTGFGLMNGKIQEYVFDDSCKNTDNMMSRLDWDIYFIPYFQGEVNFCFIKYIYLSLNGRLGFASISGNMQDYDWLNSVTPEWNDEDPTIATNYSIHDNKVDTYYNWGVNLGGNIPIINKFFITPYLGFEYDYISMSAYDGWGRYKPDYQKFPLFGKVISYSQLFYALTFGIKFDINYFEKFPISMNFRIAPKTGKLTAIDLHHKRLGSDSKGIAFCDYYDNITFLDFNISFDYKLNKYMNVGISSFIQYMPIMKGLTAYGPIDDDGTPPDTVNPVTNTKGGASRFLYSFNLFIKFIL